MPTTRANDAKNGKRPAAAAANSKNSGKKKKGKTNEPNPSFVQNLLNSGVSVNSQNQLVDALGTVLMENVPMASDVVASLTPIAPPVKQNSFMAAMEAARADGRYKKASRRGTKDPNAALIKMAVDEEYFRLQPFPSRKPQAEAQLASKLCDSLEKQGHFGPDGDKALWVDTYKGVISKKINEKRGYAMSQIAAVAAEKWWEGDKAWLDSHDNLPTVAELELCITRQVDLDDPHQYQLFRWYNEHFIPKGSGNCKTCGLDKAQYHTMSKAKLHLDDPACSKPAVPAQLEAFCVASFEGGRSAWTEKRNLRLSAEFNKKKVKFIPKTKIEEGKGLYFKKPDEDQPTDGTELWWLNDAKFFHEFTVADQGQQSGAMWTAAGSQCYKQRLAQAKVVRSKTPEGKAARDKEKAYLAKLRGELGLKCDSAIAEKKLKRKKTGTTVVDLGDDEFDLEDEEEIWDSDAEDDDDDGPQDGDQTDDE